MIQLNNFRIKMKKKKMWIALFTLVALNGNDIAIYANLMIISWNISFILFS